MTSPAPESAPPLIEMRGITVRFPGIVANDSVSLELRPGEIHALLGENGAGKTTLMNVLDGIHPPDDGEILVGGQRVRIRNPREAMRLGIGMIHQHFMLVECLSVLENVALSLPGQGLLLDRRALRERILATARDFDLEVRPDARVGELSVGEQQRVEILKTLLLNARILILDEPTAVLVPREAQELARILRELRAQGQGIIYISHKMAEIQAICDRVTVLRRGRCQGTFEVAGCTVRDLAERMIGRELPEATPPPELPPGAPVLEIQDLELQSCKHCGASRALSLSVHEHEILGIAGVAGNGQAELALAVAGLTPVLRGRIRIGGKDLTHAGARERALAGLRHIPADRLGDGLAPSLSVIDNAILRSYRAPPVARGWRLDHRAARARCMELVRRMDVRITTPEAAIRTLSGGNLQKLIVAREIEGAPRFLLAENPTRGLDVGATEAVREALLAERARGAAILLISEDLDELCAIADRIAVIFEGRLVTELPARGADRATLGLRMAGA